MSTEITEELNCERLDARIIRSPLLLVTAILLTVGALMSWLTVIGSFDISYRAAILSDLQAKQITDVSAQMTWFFIILIARLMISVFTTGMAAGIALIVIPMYAKGDNGLRIGGFTLIGRLNRALVLVWYILFAIALAFFAYRLVTSSVLIVESADEFLLPLIAVVFGEIVMLLCAAIVVYVCVKFSQEMSGLAYQSYYMLRTGRTESHIDPLCHVMLFALTAVFGYLVYFFLYDILSVLCFSFLAVATLLLGISVKLFKKEVEWIKYRNYKARRDKEKS